MGERFICIVLACPDCSASIGSIEKADNEEKTKMDLASAFNRVQCKTKHKNKIFSQASARDPNKPIGIKAADKSVKKTTKKGKKKK